jgi:hypothetical protein
MLDLARLGSGSAAFTRPEGRNLLATPSAIHRPLQGDFSSRGESRPGAVRMCDVAQAGLPLEWELLSKVKIVVAKFAIGVDELYHQFGRAISGHTTWAAKNARG